MDKILIISTIFLCLVAELHGHPTKRLENNQDEVSADFEFIGSGGGKSFFVVKRDNLTWARASFECTDLNMRLAEFTSTTHVAALNPNPSSSSFTERYWTGGRDALIPRQFSWNYSNQEVSSNVAPFTSYDGVQKCLTMKITKTNGVITDRRLEAYLCSKLYYVLCETPTL